MNSIHDVADYIILKVKSEDETASFNQFEAAEVIVLCSGMVLWYK